MRPRRSTIDFREKASYALHQLSTSAEWFFGSPCLDRFPDRAYLGAKWCKVVDFGPMDGVGFLGEFEHTIDDKGRVFVPKRFLAALPPDEPRVFFVTKGLDGCLSLFTRSAWKAAVEQMRNKPEGDQETRNFRRVFFSLASDQGVDKAGRILIPERLRKIAGLGRDVVFIGSYDKIELWDRARWAEVYGEISPEYETYAKDVLR